MSGTDVAAVVIGLGCLGSPLAQEATRAGLRVAGFGVCQGVVDGLNAGRSHVDDLSDGDIAEMVAGFEVTTDEARIGAGRAVLICVPTPLSDEGGLDLTALDAAAAMGEAGLTVLVQNHRAYDVDALAGAARKFFDTRGKATEADKVYPSLTHHLRTDATVLTPKIRLRALSPHLSEFKREITRLFCPEI